VDTLGWPLVANNPALTDSWEVPKYPYLTFGDVVQYYKEILKHRQSIISGVY